MRRRGTLRLLPGLKQAVRRSGLLPEVFVLAALLAALAPWLVWHALERQLPATTFTLAVPAATPAQDLDASLVELRSAAPVVTVEAAPSAAIEELWVSLYGTDAPAPLLLDVRLWPATLIDADRLREAIAQALPGAVVEVYPSHLPQAWTALPAAALWLALLLALVLRVRRGARRVLTAERDALTLLVAFGGKPERVDALVAAPLRRRLTFAAAIGGVLGGAAGLALVLAAQALSWESLLGAPWWALAAAPLAIAALTTLLVRVVGARVLHRRLRLAMA